MNTQIWIDKDLLARADALAREMGMSRDELFEAAMRRMLEQHENKRMLDALNAVYGEDSGALWSAEDKALAAAHRTFQRRRLRDDRWD